MAVTYPQIFRIFSRGREVGFRRCSPRIVLGNLGALEAISAISITVVHCFDPYYVRFDRATHGILLCAHFLAWKRQSSRAVRVRICKT